MLAAERPADDGCVADWRREPRGDVTHLHGRRHLARGRRDPGQQGRHDWRLLQVFSTFLSDLTLLSFKKWKIWKKIVHSSYRVKYNISFTTPDLQSVFIDIHIHIISADGAGKRTPSVSRLKTWLASSPPQTAPFSTSVSYVIVLGDWRHRPR